MSEERLCEYTWNPGRWPYAQKCKTPAVVRVRLYEEDGSRTELDLCKPHEKLAAGFYPDNIEELEEIQ